MPPRLRIFLLLLFMLVVVSSSHTEFTKEKMIQYREKVRSMFYHAYNGYLEHAYPMDELKPITCTGQDTWGSFSLTLVDSLDTLFLMNNLTEFERASRLVLQSVRPDADVNVSVFETNIRVVGGLLSAHILAGLLPPSDLNEGWPCSGPLLSLAHSMAERLLPAFQTDTGMPFGTVNLRYGVHKDETPITCTAGVSTFIIEFGTLSRLTGDERFEKVAIRALESLWKSRSPIGLVGNHINVHTAQWTATDAGIGAGVDSYFEYLVKGALLFRRPRLIKQFYDYEEVINRHIRKEDWFVWVSMTKATVSLPIFQSLEAFWPGMLTLLGNVGDAYRITMNYARLVRKYGFPPEFYRIHDKQPQDGRAAFPLRPELIESMMYLYRATKDPTLLEIGAQMVDAIEASARTRCGYATVNKVHEHNQEDRMESFFLAETTKYLFLLFDKNNLIHVDESKGGRVVDSGNASCVVYAGGYIFNTEAHPIDPGILHCCTARDREERREREEFVEDIDVITVLDTLMERNVKAKIKVSDLSEETNDLNEESKSAYITQQYGSDQLEFEVDESLKEEEKKVEDTVGEEKEEGYKEIPAEEKSTVEGRGNIEEIVGEGKEEKREGREKGGEEKELEEEEEDDDVDVNEYVKVEVNEEELNREKRRMKMELGRFEWTSEEKPLMEQTEVIRQVQQMLRKARIVDEDKRARGVKGSRLTPQLMSALEKIATEMLEDPPPTEMTREELHSHMAIRAALDQLDIPLVYCNSCCLPLDHKGDSVSLRSLLSSIYRNHLYPSRGTVVSRGPLCWEGHEPKREDDYMTQLPDMTHYRIFDELPIRKVSWEFAVPEWRDLVEQEWNLLSVRGPDFEEKIMGGFQVVANDGEKRRMKKKVKEEYEKKSWETNREEEDEKRKEREYEEWMEGEYGIRDMVDKLREELSTY